MPNPLIQSKAHPSQTLTGEGANQALNNYYGGGGSYYPGLFSDLNIELPNIQQPGSAGYPALPQPQVQPQSDPFLQFLLGQLAIAGLNQNAPQPQGRQRWGQAMEQPQQISPFTSSINQLSGVDALLAELLGGF